MMKKFRNAALALSFAIYFCLFWCSPAMAGLIDSTLSDGSYVHQMRQNEIEKIQSALENQVVRDKLSTHGLRSEEIKSKLGQMSDDQIHMLAQASDDVLAGGDAVGFVVGVLLIVLLVVVILKLLDKEIIIK